MYGIIRIPWPLDHVQPWRFAVLDGTDTAPLFKTEGEAEDYLARVKGTE